MNTEKRIYGKWKVVNSAIPSYNVKEETISFDESGKMTWSLDGHVLIYPYFLDPQGFVYTVKNEKVSVKALIAGDSLTLCPPHGHKSIAVRL